MRFKIDRASLTVGSKFTVFALFHFVFEGNFQVQPPGGAYIWRDDLTEGFFRYDIWRGLCMKGLIFGILWYFIRQNKIVHFVYFIQGVQRRHTWMSLGWDVY